MHAKNSKQVVANVISVMEIREKYSKSQQLWWLLIWVASLHEGHVVLFLRKVREILFGRKTTQTCKSAATPAILVYYLDALFRQVDRKEKP